MIQDIVLIITIIGMAVVTATFAYVALNAASEAVDYPEVQKKSYGIRAKFFWAFAISGVIITTLTTLDLPYAATRGDIPENAVEVNVEGRMWAWILDKKEATVGDTVVFNVSAADVTHGLGIYDTDMRMMGQVQAMPFGYVNKLKLTFDKPGNYKLICLEYCGLAHHNMISEFTIKPAAVQATN